MVAIKLHGNNAISDHAQCQLRSCSTSGPVSTEIGDRPDIYPSNLCQLSLHGRPSRVAAVSSLLAMVMATAMEAMASSVQQYYDRVLITSPKGH